MDIWGLSLPSPQSDQFVQAANEVSAWAETVSVNDNGYSVLPSEPEMDVETASVAVAHLRQQKELQEPEKAGDRRQYRRYAVSGGAELRVKGTGDAHLGSDDRYQRIWLLR